MSKVLGEQIIDVLSSHNKELCHVDELKNLANFFFFLSQWLLGRRIVCTGWKLCSCNLNLHSRCKEKRDQLSGDSGDWKVRLAIRGYVKGKITALETAWLWSMEMCPCWLTLSLDKVNGIMNRSGDSWGRHQALDERRWGICVYWVWRDAGTFVWRCLSQVL